MLLSNHAIRAALQKDQRTVYYAQNDVDVIREQIIQAESMKRRWLILGLMLSTGGLVATIALLSSSYAIYTRIEAQNNELTQQYAATSQKSNEAQQALEALRARDAARESERAESESLMQKVVSGMPDDSDGSSIQGGRFAKAIHQLGGSVETASRPPAKLFRNWKVTTDGVTEVYTVVGGLVDGKWVIYSNLVVRRQTVPKAGNASLAATPSS